MGTLRPWPWLVAGLAARNGTLLRSFGPPAIQPLGQLGSVWLNRGDVRCGLTPVSKSRKLLAGGHQLGFELGEIPDCLLLLLPLGQKLILTGFQLGQLDAQVRERAPAHQGQGAQSKTEHPVGLQPAWHVHPNHPPQEHDRFSGLSGGSPRSARCPGPPRSWATARWPSSLASQRKAADWVGNSRAIRRGLKRPRTGTMTRHAFRSLAT